MLTQTAINAAAPLAALLADKGIALIPADGSPIGALAASSAYMLNVGVAMESLPDPAGQTLTEYAGALQASSAEPHADGAHEHDILMATAVQNAANGVRYTQNLARNVIGPMVEKVIASVESGLDTVAATGLNPLNIVRRDYGQFANPALVQGLAGNFGEVLADQFNLTLHIPMPENIADYLLTGQDAIDSAVATYVESIGAEGVASLWARLFGAEASILTQVANEHKPETYGDASLAMIIVRNLLENAPAGVPVDLDQFKMYLIKMQSQLGRVLFNIPKVVDNSIATGRVVLSAPRGDRPRGDIVVNGPVYQTYLEKGGTPEAIFGALNDGVAPGLNDLLAQQERFSNTWNVTKTQLQQSEVSGRYKNTVAALSRAVSALIVELPDDQLIATREVLQERLNGLCAAVRPEELEDRWALARRLVCQAIYPHTQAEHFLTLIDTTAKAGGKVEDAVFTATTAYMAAWLAAQLQHRSV